MKIANNKPLRILIGAPVRQSPEIFKEYIASLDRLAIPLGVTVDRCFCLHGCPELKEFLHPDDGCILFEAQYAYDVSGETHEWNDANFAAVVTMKNRLLELTLEGGYDYFMLVDSDLILHPDTLITLLKRDKDICAEIFWTEWIEGSGEFGPNCWEIDAMSCLPDFQRRFRQPGCYRVAGTGACILISRSVLEAGVNYSPLYNVSWTKWEDRAFAIRAAVMGFEEFIDTTHPARHLYREADYNRYKRLKEAKDAGR